MAKKPMITQLVDLSRVDLIGDVHGCIDELQALFAKLGYTQQDGMWLHPTHTPVFLGDLVDRGPGSDKVFAMVLKMWRAGKAVWVRGNHDDKCFRYMKGNPVSMDADTVRCINNLYPDPVQRAALGQDLLDTVPHKAVLDGGKLVACHAAPFGAHQSMYGPRDADNNRLPWWDSYQGDAFVAFGHYWGLMQGPNAMCLDGYACRGGKLTALRWPSRQMVQVDALAIYDQDGMDRMKQRGQC